MFEIFVRIRLGRGLGRDIQHTQKLIHKRMIQRLITSTLIQDHMNLFRLAYIYLFQTLDCHDTFRFSMSCQFHHTERTTSDLSHDVVAVLVSVMF